MSHNIEYFTYEENINRDFVKRRLDNFVSHADWQEGCSGLYNGIRWMDSVPACATEQDARECIEKLDRGDYDNVAVRFYEPQKIDTKAYQVLLEKVKQAAKVYRDKDSVKYAETIHAAYVGCKVCGSKISRVHIRTNRCPVCGADLRPKTTLDAIDAAAEKYRKAQRAADDYRVKHAPKKVMWLVKIEYHT